MKLQQTNLLACKWGKISFLLQMEMLALLSKVVCSTISLKRWSRTKAVSAFAHTIVLKYERPLENWPPTLMFWKPWLGIISFSMCSEIVQITYLLWMKRVVFKKTQPRKIFIYVLMFAWKYIDIKWHFQRKMGEVVSISLPAIDCYLSSQSQRNDFRQFIIVSHRSWLSWTIVAQSLSRDCCHLVTMAESSRGFITSNSDTWARVAGTAGSAISLCLWPPDD